MGLLFLEETELVFLGTGGGRFITITQKRQTGGLRILHPVNIQLDPGPGAIVYANRARLDPSKTRAVVVSHCHLDHYGDAEVFIEAMTGGMIRKRGLLVAPRSVIKGNQVFDACISKYHQSMPERIVEVKAGDQVDIEQLHLIATRAQHSDPDTVGFRINLPSGDVGYTSDTEYFEGLGKQYEGVRLLILCVLRPRGLPWKGHLSSEDAEKIINEAEPEVSVITDFGVRMVYAGPGREAKAIEDRTGIRTVAATDNMRVRIGKEIRFESESEQPSLNRFTQ